MYVDNEPNEIIVVNRVESDLPSTSDSVESVSIPRAENNHIVCTDERNDIGLYVSKMSETPDFKKFELLTNPWQPPPNYRLPFSEHQNKGKRQCRYFNRQFLIDFDWLVLSDVDKGLYCKFCAIFAIETAYVKYGALVKTPLTNFARLTGKEGSISSHASKHYHANSLLAAQSFIESYKNPSKKIINQVSSQRHQQATENRKRLVPIIETIILCGRQNMALRGHRDDGNVLDHDLSSNDGNFRALLRFRVAAGDKLLEEHLKNSASKATYVSKTTQNELIECCKLEIQHEIINRVEKSGPYSVIFDETTDASGIEQLSLSLRYVHDEKIREDFVTFVDAYERVSQAGDLSNEARQEVRLTGEALGKLVVKLLTEFGLNLDLCVGIGTDNCAVMASQAKGAVAEIQKYCKNASRCPCFNHSLNNSLAQTSKVSQTKNAIVLMKNIIRFSNASAKRTRVFRSHLGKSFKGLCETRWSEKHDGISQFKSLLPKIVDALNEISEWNDAKSAMEAKTLVLSVDFEFVVAVSALHDILSTTRPLSLVLQSPSLDLNAALNVLTGALNVLHDSRQNAESAFKNIFHDATSLAESPSVQVPVAMPRIASRQKYRDNHPSSSPEEYYRVSLFVPLLDNIIEDLKCRLPEGTLNCFNLNLFLPKKIESTIDNSHRFWGPTPSIYWESIKFGKIIGRHPYMTHFLIRLLTYLNTATKPYIQVFI